MEWQATKTAPMDSCGVDYVGDIQPMSDAEKIEHLENWINEVVKTCEPSTGNPILDNAKIQTIKSCLKKALEYDNRNIIIRLYL